MRLKHLYKAMLLFALLISLQSVDAAPLTKVTIELKWFHQFQFAGIYAAEQQGYYRDEGLDVKILERDKSSSPVTDVLSGKVQFGISDSTIIRDKLLGKQLVILAAIFQHSPLVLITLEKSGLISPLELKGKRIMYQKNVDDAIIVGMFNEFGISRDQIIFVPHTFDDEALIKGQADAMSAYLSNQPFLYKQKGIKINIIKPQNYGIDFYGDLLFTSEDYFKSNRKVALAFRRATLRGWEYALSHKDELIELIKKKYAPSRSIAALKYEASIIEQMIAKDQIKLGELSKKRIEY
ncbi:MAG: ABC transporter substrate-binding protein, partial [Coxiellaceae bacterium]|nr:ABC transporter substrate-binding protein [Coxiellaceae bacterium]